MASYISSYLGRGGASTTPNYGQYQPQYTQYQQGPAQASGISWTSAVSSRVGALRKALTRGSAEDDDDNEDCSHVSNVLRAYYTEKGRPFPEWLPPDPKNPSLSAPQSQYGQYGNYPQNATHSRGSSQSQPGRGGGLSDLWDSGPSQPQQPQVQSLRAPRPQAQGMRSFDTSSRAGGSESPVPRPLPSQRSGSYQNVQQASTSTTTAGNPRDRLRARLQGGAGARNSASNSEQQQS